MRPYLEPRHFEDEMSRIEMVWRGYATPLYVEVEVDRECGEEGLMLWPDK